MVYRTTDIDSIVSRIETEAKRAVAEAGTPKITKNSVNLELRTFDYQKVSPLTKPLSVNHVSYNNDTDDPTEAHFPVLTTKTTATFSYSFTEGVKFGAKFSFQVGVPAIESFSAEISLELNFSATQTQTNTVEQDWTYDEPIPVPRRSKVCADLLIDHMTYDTTFTGEVVITGQIVADARSGNAHHSVHDQYRMDIARWIYEHKDEYPGMKFEDFSDGEEHIPSKAICTVTGDFKGVVGTNVRIDAHQVKVGADCPALHDKADTVT